jgi:hypothetical protein
MKKWKMTVYTNSDWAGDKDNQHSVLGYAIFLSDMVILWKSKLQKPLALSSSEAEYYGMSEAAKDVKFVAMILEVIGIEIELQISMYCDNVGAIFMAENVMATARTKHIDTRYHFVRVYVESGFLKIVFMNSKKNKQICSPRMFQVNHMTNIKGHILLEDKMWSRIGISNEGC